jgi:hypothetical protein
MDGRLVRSLHRGKKENAVFTVKTFCMTISSGRNDEK